MKTSLILPEGLRLVDLTKNFSIGSGKSLVGTDFNGEENGDGGVPCKKSFGGLAIFWVDQVEIEFGNSARARVLGRESGGTW